MHLMLLSDEAARLRCRRCHLTLTEEELRGGCCPECYESTGVRHYEFDPVPAMDNTRYRCEQCGAIIEYQTLQETK